MYHCSGVCVYTTYVDPGVLIWQSLQDLCICIQNHCMDNEGLGVCVAVAEIGEQTESREGTKSLRFLQPVGQLFQAKDDAKCREDLRKGASHLRNLGCC